MKVLLVGGIYDYGALNFEKNVDKDEWLGLWEQARKNENNRIEKEIEIENYEGIIKEKIIIDAYEFEQEVSDEFLKFIRDEVQDYEDAKHNNFYIIER